MTLVRDIGAGLGTVGGSLIARAACAGLPCPVVSVDLASGRRTTLAAGAFAAAIGGLAGDRLVVETAADQVAVVDLTGAGDDHVDWARSAARQGIDRSRGRRGWTGHRPPGATRLDRGQGDPPA